MKIDKGLMADMSPEEVAAIEGRAAAATTDEVIAEAAGVESDAAEVTEAAEPTEQAPAQEAAEPAAAEAAEAEPVEAAEPAKPVAYQVPDTDFKAQREALRAEKRALVAKWSEGELTDVEYAEQDDQIGERLSEITAQQTRADTLREITEQNRLQAQRVAAEAENAAMAALAAASKAAGQVDYATDKPAAAQFDALFAAAKLDPANSGLAAAALVQKAHSAVLALRGIVTAPKAEAAQPKPKPVIPQTLGNLPTAAAQPVGIDMADQLQAIDDPDVLEAKWAAMPASQRQQMLRATLPRGGRH